MHFCSLHPASDIGRGERGSDGRSGSGWGKQEIRAAKELCSRGSVGRHHGDGGTIMISRHLAAALVTTLILSGGAYAQSSETKSTTTTTTAATASHEGWRASKLAGVDVYNDQNEKIGDISDVILDKSGKATNVIIGVGGFLGMGEHLVAVPFEKMKWVNEPVRSATTTSSDRPATANPNARTDSTATTGTASTTTSSRSSSGNNWYPDHAVYNATKDQLKQMPEFKY
jgi:sporulation protein YlmC with PRC-barrel domain